MKILFGVDFLFNDPAENEYILISQLKNYLRQYFTHVPEVGIVPYEENDNSYAIYVGFTRAYTGELGSKDEFFQVLQQYIFPLIDKYSVTNVSSNELCQLRQGIIEDIKEKNFNTAIDKLAILYYNSVLISNKDLQAQAMLSLTYIQTLNQDSNAFYSAYETTLLTESNSFCNSYLRFYSRVYWADMLWSTGNIDDALQEYDCSLSDFKIVDDYNEKVYYLWKVANVYVFVFLHCQSSVKYYGDKAVSYLIEAKTLIESNINNDNNCQRQLSMVNDYIIMIQGEYINFMERRHQALVDQYNKLNHSLIHKLGQIASNVVQQCLPFLVGSILKSNFIIGGFHNNGIIENQGGRLIL